MTPEFLRQVQRNGYRIEAVTEEGCIARCPAEGCGLRLNIRENGFLPRRPGQDTRPEDRPIPAFRALQAVLKARREELTLTIGETEDMAGFAQHHLSKAEADKVQRIPNFDFLIDWCEALGFEFVLRPKQMPPLSLRYLAETRHMHEARRQQNRKRRSA